MKRREFIAGLGGAVAWPVVARAQQAALPVVGYINVAALESSARYVTAFRAGLAEIGYVEGRNVTVEYHWLENRFDRVPAVVAELVRRPVTVIAAPGQTAVALAAKAATTTIPIVFSIGDDPVKFGLVASLAQPGGNATGMNFFSIEAVPKRMGLMHELVPKAVPIAVLINPSNVAVADASLREVQDAASKIGLPIMVLKATNNREIEEVFAIMVRERAEALFITSDAYFGSRRVQLATLAIRHGIATSYADRAFVEAGGLMSYGADITETYRQAGVYTGQILKGTKPADLPVVQSTKFELVINLRTAKALGLTIPETLLATADEVIQ
jgi:putative ABC transport system substrate-binding protein